MDQRQKREEARKAVVAQGVATKLVETGQAAAAATIEVKKALAASESATLHSLEKITELAEKTHTLVNSQMGLELMLHAVTARTLANLTKKPEHVKAADAAEKKLREHEAKQAVVDAGNHHE
jgi:hypothetical protein